MQQRYRDGMTDYRARYNTQLYILRSFNYRIATIISVYLSVWHHSRYVNAAGNPLIHSFTHSASASHNRPRLMYRTSKLSLENSLNFTAHAQSGLPPAPGISEWHAQLDSGRTMLTMFDLCSSDRAPVPRHVTIPTMPRETAQTILNIQSSRHKQITRMINSFIN